MPGAHPAPSSPPGADDLPAPPPLWLAAVRMALRLAVVVAAIYLVHLLLDGAMTMTERLPEAGGARARILILGCALLFYGLLIAIPFVPGIEIGLGLLMLRGAEVAPWVYLATLAGLALAFLSGRLLPVGVLGRLFLDLRLARAAAMIDRLEALSPEDRLSLLEARLPGRFARPLVSLRYLGLALLLNLPGNAVIGGGGGIALLAGLSRVFAPAPTLLAVALGVAPVPLAIWLLGLQGW